MSERGVVLLIEDEESIADMLRSVFEREGFRVHHSVTGQGGLDRLRQSPPRAVLLDLNLPDMDGVEVCRKIRADSAVPVSPVLALYTATLVTESGRPSGQSHTRDCPVTLYSRSWLRWAIR